MSNDFICSILKITPFRQVVFSVQIHRYFKTSTLSGGHPRNKARQSGIVSPNEFIDINFIENIQS